MPVQQLQLSMFSFDFCQAMPLPRTNWLEPDLTCSAFLLAILQVEILKAPASDLSGGRRGGNDGLVNVNQTLCTFSPHWNLANGTKWEA